MSASIDELTSRITEWAKVANRWRRRCDDGDLERAVAESDDEIERIVRVVAALGTAVGRPSETEDQPDELLPPMLLPEMRDRRLRGSWWDHDAVQEWSLRVVKVPPEPLTAVHFRKTVFGGTKKISTKGHGWSFPSGATIPSGERGMPTYYVFNVSVLTDGRRLLGANADSNPGIQRGSPQANGYDDRTSAATLDAEDQLLPPETGVRVWPVQAKH